MPSVKTKERTSACPKAPFYVVSTSRRKIFTFLLVPKSLWTLTLPTMANQRRPVASREHADAVPIGVFFFFFRPLFSVRRSAWNERGLPGRERHVLRESVLLTPTGQMMRPLTIESSARGCRASEVKFGQDSRSSGQYAVCTRGDRECQWR